MVVVVAKRRNWEVSFVVRERKRWRRRPNNQREKAVKRRRVILLLLLFFMDLRIRRQILGITVMGFGIYRLLRFLGDYTVCWVVSRIHGCWRTNPTFGLQLHKCRSSCYNWLFLLLYIRGHVDQDQTKIKN